MRRTRRRVISPYLARFPWECIFESDSDVSRKEAVNWQVAYIFLISILHYTVGAPSFRGFCERMGFYTATNSHHENHVPPLRGSGLFIYATQGPRAWARLFRPSGCAHEPFAFIHNQFVCRKRKMHALDLYEHSHALHVPQIRL
jgi:hypothetical protein